MHGSCTVHSHHVGLRPLRVCCAAQALQAEGAWHEAERHFCEAKEWKGAVAMYRQQGSWEDALRVAKVLGTMEAAKQVGHAATAEFGGHCEPADAQPARQQADSS